MIKNQDKLADKQLEAATLEKMKAKMTEALSKKTMATTASSEALPKADDIKNAVVKPKRDE